MKSLFQIRVLGECIDQVSVRSKGRTNAKVFSVTNSEGFKLSTEYFSKEVFSKDTSNYKVVERGEFAYNPSRINVGSIDYLRIADSALVSPLYVVFKPKKKILSGYLLRFLKSDWGNLQIRANTEGAVRDSLKYKGLEKIKIPLPPLEDQKRIASILTRVEKLIVRRKESIQLLDELLKSTFLEMFGDPVRNEKGWKIDSLSSFGSYKNGINFSRNESGEKVYYLGVGDFKSESKISDIQRLSKIDLSKMPTDDYFLENGDIVFVRSNGNRELVGRSIEIFPNKEKVVYSGFCIRYRIEDKSLKSTYVSHLFRVKSFRKAMLGSNRGANIQNINQRLLSELIIPIPPIELQKNFSIIVEKIESIKSRYQESLSEFENLYGSLSQKAFKGELDLSKILLPKEDEPGDKETKSIQIQAFQAKDEPENKTIKTIATIALAAGGVYLAKKLFESITRKDDQIEDFILTESYLNEIIPKTVLLKMFDDVKGRFSFIDLWGKIRDSIISEMPENVSLASGWEDLLYQHIKSELFNLLEEKKLSQIFDEEKKKMLLSVNR